MVDLKNVSWEIKYRPNTVKDVISVHTQKILKQLENPKAIQNFLFHSRIGGTGKTSMAMAIIRDLKCDYLMLNASEERSIEVVRIKVKEFCSCMSSNPDTKKCIWMDEGEKLTKDAMDALKNMVETYAVNAFFIMTTNNLNKINQPMQSRFNVMEFTQPDKNLIESFLINICVKENLDCSEKIIKKLINVKYPSIRSMVTKLQDIKIEGKQVTEEDIFASSKEFDDVLELIKQANFSEIKKKVWGTGFDCVQFNKWLFEKVISMDGEVGKQIKLIKIAADLERDFKFGADENIVFLDAVPKLMEVFR